MHPQHFKRDPILPRGSSNAIEREFFLNVLQNAHEQSLAERHRPLKICPVGALRTLWSAADAQRCREVQNASYLSGSPRV